MDSEETSSNGLGGLARELRALAGRQGFPLCGIAPASPPPHAEQYLQWLRDGKHATMQWMERSMERRLDLEKTLPGVRSVVALGAPYWQGGPPIPISPARAATQGARGRIARYAWGGDYHDWIIGQLGPLENLLASRGGIQKSYTDTGPILERDYAALAGLGWHGKSTMLIHRRAGTWFFLAEILTTLDLPPDRPETDHCGSCLRCVNACPTGAIDTPHVLDARKCLSYWTIEHKGSIPENFRTALGDRIYGCDDCLDACPWNRFAQVSREAVFQAREGTDGWLLRDYLALDDAAFRTLFHGSPIKRIKRGRFLRNVCIALGNVGGVDDLQALCKAAGDPDALVQEHALWAIERIKSRNR